MSGLVFSDGGPVRPLTDVVTLFPVYRKGYSITVGYEDAEQGGMVTVFGDGVTNVRGLLRERMEQLKAEREREVVVMEWEGRISDYRVRIDADIKLCEAAINVGHWYQNKQQRA